MSPRQKNLSLNKDILSNIKNAKNLNLLKEIPNALDNYMVKITDNNAQGEDTVIITCCSDIDGGNSITLFDVNFSKINSALNPHKHSISSVASFPFSPYPQMNKNFDESFFITGDSIGTLKLWSKNIEEIFCLEQAHKSSIVKIAVVPNPLFVVSLSKDSLKIWEKKNIEENKENKEDNENQENKEDKEIANNQKEKNQKKEKEKKFNLNLNNSKISEGRLFEKFCIIPVAQNDFYIALCESQGNLIIYDLNLNEVSRKNEAHKGKKILQVCHIKNFAENLLISLDNYGNIKVWDLTLNLIAEKIEGHTNAFDLTAMNYMIEENGYAIGLFGTYSNKMVKIWDEKLNLVKEIQNNGTSNLHAVNVENEIYLLLGTNNQKMMIYK